MGHSPGPWHMDGAEILDADGTWVGETLDLSRPDHGAANAVLMAASPDLLAELRLIVEGWVRKGRDLTEWESERLQFAMVAVAKAEGRDA
jgi:hypothetical protein